MVCPECESEMLLSMQHGGIELWTCPYCLTEVSIDVCDTMSAYEAASMYEGESDGYVS